MWILCRHACLIWINKWYWNKVHVLTTTTILKKKNERVQANCIVFVKNLKFNGLKRLYNFFSTFNIFCMLLYKFHIFLYFFLKWLNYDVALYILFYRKQRCNCWESLLWDICNFIRNGWYIYNTVTFGWYTKKMFR